MTNDNYIADLKELYQSVVTWGDYKEAGKIALQIERLKKRDIVAQLGQSSFSTGRAMFPNAIVIQTYSRSLEIDGDLYRPNLHDSGHVMGWHCVS